MYHLIVRTKQNSVNENIALYGTTRECFKSNENKNNQGKFREYIIFGMCIVCCHDTCLLSFRSFEVVCIYLYILCLHGICICVTVLILRVLQANYNSSFHTNLL